MSETATAYEKRFIEETEFGPSRTDTDRGAPVWKRQYGAIQDGHAEVALSGFRLAFWDYVELGRPVAAAFYRHRVLPENTGATGMTFFNPMVPIVVVGAGWEVVERGEQHVVIERAPDPPLNAPLDQESKANRDGSIGETARLDHAMHPTADDELNMTIRTVRHAVHTACTLLLALAGQVERLHGQRDGLLDRLRVVEAENKKLKGELA